ncbi:hypothetical protein ACHHYP_17042 [Achlya hypogyna]|uniref:Uncharacterized protein n=1 Tax=Achlya hypogyna TaxID=1202772 RepID=A0A1V9Y5C8_ACHHY|nr:hypothetical protein ACHHYP_17042 [Achlya hypogyna]
MTHAATSRFHVSYCDHDDVFEPSYTRYQKAHKIKVVRCFPHCCPRHVYYRYCGAPLELHTMWASDVRSPERYASLLKMAPVSHADWAIGDDMPPVSLADLDDDDDATWHQGCQRWQVANVLVSTFNAELLDGWTYRWKSGRSLALRDCQHRVTAYVFEMREADVWRVVAKAVSPAFTIATYRSAAKDPSLSLAAPSKALAAPSLSWTASSIALAAPTLALTAPSLSVATSTAAMTTALSMAVAPSLTEVTLPTPTAGGLVSARTQVLANHLGALFCSVDASQASIPEAAQRRLLQYLGHPARPSTPPPTDCIHVTSLAPTTPEDIVVAEWLVHLLHPHNVAQYEAVVLAHRESVLERAALARAYSDGVQLLHSVSERYFRQAHGTTVAAVVAAVVAARPQLEAQLQARVAAKGYCGFHAVVAHLRQVALVRPAAQLQPSLTKR